jgi:hypothetical protein
MILGIQARRLLGGAAIVLSCGALVAPASAQGFNVDFAKIYGTPSSAYGAAAGQTGFWNHKDHTTASITLLDTTGTPTAVSLAHTATPLVLGHNHPSTTGDQQALLDDFLDGNKTITFTGLANGNYAVYTYAWGPESGTYLTRVRVTGANEPDKVVGGSWAGDHTEGVTYARHTVTIANGSLTIACTVENNFSSINGVQVVPLSPPVPKPTTYCTGKSGMYCGMPKFRSTGTASASQSSGFVITTGPAVSDRLGFLLYTNTGRANKPFPKSGHILCIQTLPLRWGGPVYSGGTPGTNCDGAYAIDMNAYAAGLYAPGFPTLPYDPFLRNPGEQINCQIWGRDTASTGSFMSDAIEYVVGP